MKKIITVAVAILLCVTASAKRPKAKQVNQTFSKGDLVVDLGFGLGISQYTDLNKDKNEVEKVSGATFTQKLGFEVGVAKFGKFTLGLGAMVNNSYGAGYESSIIGSYNYTYFRSTHSWSQYAGPRPQWTTRTEEIRRTGFPKADADAHIDAISVLIKGSLHYQFVKNLDTYATIGLGIAGRKTIYSNQRNTKGLDAGSREFNPGNHTVQISYSFDDAEHVVWKDSEMTTQFAFAIAVGARYYLTDNWALNAEIGLNSADFKEGFTTKKVKLADLSIFSIGASYKF